MMAALKALVPGAEHWPRFVRNRGEQFEGRFSLVEILELAGRAAGGHGRFACCPSPSRTARVVRSSRIRQAQAQLQQAGQVAFPLCGRSAGGWPARYPANPNGSPRGIAAVTSRDGRVLLTMPHPERSFRVVQNSWYPPGGRRILSGWMRMFRNARRWVD